MHESSWIDEYNNQCRLFLSFNAVQLLTDELTDCPAWESAYERQNEYLRGSLPH